MFCIPINNFLATKINVFFSVQLPDLFWFFVGFLAG